MSQLLEKNPRICSTLFKLFTIQRCAIASCNYIRYLGSFWNSFLTKSWKSNETNFGKLKFIYILILFLLRWLCYQRSFAEFATQKAACRTLIRSKGPLNSKYLQKSRKEDRKSSLGRHNLQSRKKYLFYFNNSTELRNQNLLALHIPKIINNSKASIKTNIRELMIMI